MTYTLLEQREDELLEQMEAFAEYCDENDISDLEGQFDLLFNGVYNGH